MMHGTIGIQGILTVLDCALFVWPSSLRYNRFVSRYEWLKLSGSRFARAELIGRLIYDHCLKRFHELSLNIDSLNCLVICVANHLNNNKLLAAALHHI